MPVITSCPDCDKKLKVPDDLLGKKVKCPGCASMFTAKEDGGDARPAGKSGFANKAAPPPPPRRRDDEDDRDRDRGRDRDRDDDRDRDRDRGRGRDRDDRDRDDRDRDRYRDDRDRGRRDDDYDDDDRGRGRGRGRRDDYDDDYGDRRESPRDIRNKWLGVRSGLNLATIGCWLIAGGVGMTTLAYELLIFTWGGLFIGLMSGFGAAMGGRGGMDFFNFSGMPASLMIPLLFLMLAGLVTFAGQVLALVGMGMSLQVPSTRYSSSFGLALAAFICAVLYVLAGASLAFAGGVGLGVAVSMPNLLFLGAAVCWALFLNSMGKQLRAESVSGKAMSWMIGAIVVGAVSTVLFILLIQGVFFSMFGARTFDGARTAATMMMIMSAIFTALIGFGYAGLFLWQGFILGDAKRAVERILSRS